MRPTPNQPSAERATVDRPQPLPAVAGPRPFLCAGLLVEVYERCDDGGEMFGDDVLETTVGLRVTLLVGAPEHG